MNINKLQESIEYLQTNTSATGIEIDSFVNEFYNALNSGAIRAAQPDSNNNWIINEWVKQGILLLFKIGKLKEITISSEFNFFDKHTLPLKKVTLDDGLRIVPGGSAIRNGAYLAKGVICMPPMYINIGSYIDEDTMIDSHALVGTCAQIGKRVHISAGTQIGGVLEPIGARPVIIEDDVLVGGNCGLYEGVLVRKKAVIGSGVVINSSMPIYDIVNEKIIKKSDNNILEIPEGAVVVSGSRAINSDFGKLHSLSISTPLIIKYRDSKTESKTTLEEYLRY